jgi:hypothetical protein
VEFRSESYSVFSRPTSILTFLLVGLNIVIRRSMVHDYRIILALCNWSSLSNSIKIVSTVRKNIICGRKRRTCVRSRSTNMHRSRFAALPMVIYGSSLAMALNEYQLSIANL